MEYKIIRISDVKAKTCLSRSTIYLRMAEGKFPQQISLGSRAVGWINSEVIDWIEHQISESRGVVLKKD
jgi:prophage regulatory protein